MSRKTQTRLTFALSIDMPTGMNIPSMREFIKTALASEVNARNPDDAIKALDVSGIKLHLTNKETSYAKG